MKSLPVLNLAVIAIYLISMILVGFYFSRKNRSSDQFTRAAGSIPGWAIGLSIYATFLSSNTFLGVPGKAFGTNWNNFVFSLAMPLAAWIASKYFVPFYRRTGEVSAYTHLEKRFGSWARTYAVACFLLTQLARMGSIFFGIALSLQALTGYSMQSIMIIVGTCIIIYTVLGGIEAVIWTEVVQAVIKTLGAFLILYIIVKNIPGGASRILEIGTADHKFSLGSLSPNLKESTFWVVLFYGFFINLNNFGIDQNYVQRYHTATNSRQASRSLWICVVCYVPISLLFFIIGSSLYAYYQVNPDLIESVKHQAAIERLPLHSTAATVKATMNALVPADYGDKMMPYFMVTEIPTGLVGLIISAIMSAAMSTISSGMNSSATVFSIDIYKRYINPSMNEKQLMKLLYITTAIFGIMGMTTGILMIGIKSILDIWWQLSGIFSGGMLGLFLLGMISRRTQNAEALTATIIGVLVILWMTFSVALPEDYSFLRNMLHSNMIVVIGTLTIFLSGLLLTSLRRAGPVE
ncbi:sodium:solute symporter [Pedobacter hartonius]|uniref:Solute:Na+ symporter, SSS family n=1 Tax=Pedobacter hartonius TaxID=425514 RepID=A0A1H3WF34_9SPHI|nr:sodium:solute symporter [Pedobacter hartonius]SDZ85004.1 solute:Na+ symporter, SSS family [Pedobacter hartonius]